MCVNASALLGGIQRRQEAFEVPETLGLGGMLQGLVLGQDVDKTFPDVVAVLKKEVPTPVSELVQDLSDLALRRKPAVRHS